MLATYEVEGPDRLLRQHGRPVTHHREALRRLKALVEPFSRYDNLYQILTFYRQRAGIKLPARKESWIRFARRGQHCSPR